MMKKIYLLIFCSILLASCYYDNEETLYPETEACDTTEVSYSAIIVPMLSNNCYECHSNINAPDFGNNIRLEDYADVKSQSVRMLGAIRHDPAYSPMPRGGDKLDTCFILQFEAWNNQGNKEN